MNNIPGTHSLNMRFVESWAEGAAEEERGLQAGREEYWENRRETDREKWEA
jgi:hypothetical protein